MSAEPWHPCSPYEAIDGYVWLKRMLEKARRGMAGGADMGDYVSFDASPLDQYALARWKVTGDQIRAWIGEGLDDVAIAQRLAERLGHAQLADRERWSRSYQLLYGMFMTSIDADEGRRPAGLLTSLLQAQLEVIFAIVKLRNRLLGRG